jgi:hypothetical protein
MTTKFIFNIRCISGLKHSFYSSLCKVKRQHSKPDLEESNESFISLAGYCGTLMFYQLRQEKQELEASLGHIGRPCLNKQQ